MAKSPILKAKQARCRNLLNLLDAIHAKTLLFRKVLEACGDSQRLVDVEPQIR
jgi:hypothetical protein